MLRGKRRSVIPQWSRGLWHSRRLLPAFLRVGRRVALREVRSRGLPSDRTAPWRLLQKTGNAQKAASAARTGVRSNADKRLLGGRNAASPDDLPAIPTEVLHLGRRLGTPGFQTPPSLDM